MTASEFRTQREALGHSMAAAARKCDVAYRTWQNWELGLAPVPKYAKCFIAYLRG